MQQPKKAALLLIFISLACTAPTAQDKIVFPAKVYIIAERSKLAEIAADELANQHLWNVTTDKNEADVILAIVIKRVFFNDRKAYAIFSDAKTGKQIFQTQPVTTLSRVTFAPRRGSVKKLIRKRVKECYPQQQYQQG